MLGAAAIADRDRQRDRSAARRMEFAMDPRTRHEIDTAVDAIDDALTGLVTFITTLRPTLRNEIFQLLGHHLERAREARNRLRALTVDPTLPGDPSATAATPE
jgi:hypothetical protein